MGRLLYHGDGLNTTTNKANIIDYTNTESGLDATNVQSAIDEVVSEKQNKLTQGNNITISGDTISATDTTYESKSAVEGGSDVSLVTTGEKYTWNNKLDTSGGTMNGNLKWEGTDALPQFDGEPNYLLGIESFADGGTTKWADASKVKVGEAYSAIADGNGDVIASTYASAKHQSMLSSNDSIKDLDEGIWTIYGVNGLPSDYPTSIMGSSNIYGQVQIINAYYKIAILIAFTGDYTNAKMAIGVLSSASVMVWTET